MAAAALAAGPTAEQIRLAAALPGASVSWSHDRGVPLAVRGTDLGTMNLGGRGLSSGGSFDTRAIAVLDRLAGLYRIQNASEEFVVLSTESDTTGWRHVRIEQRYRALPVVGSGLIVHFNPAGVASMINGRYIPEISLKLQAVLSADEAVRRTTDLIRNRTGSGEELRSAQAPALVVYARQGAPVLAYEVLISGEGVMSRWRCWVDALNGNLLECLTDVRTSELSAKVAVLINGKILQGEGGTGGTVSGNQDGTAYQLLSDSGYKWRIWNADTNGSYVDSGAIAWRTNSNWGISDTEEFSAAYNFWQVLVYYNSVHGRLGYDGRGTMARVNVHHPSTILENNAAWDPGSQEFYFGIPDNTTVAGMEVLDICAHEFTHAVDSKTVNLTYSRESGALSESFADILGALAEFSIQPDGRGAYPQYTAGCADWLIGEDCTIGGPWGMRDMRNPASPLTSTGSQPTKYRGTYWVTGSEDNGGVHANNGVQNFFFYLMVEGGAGNNEGQVYNITGLGLEAGHTLAYKVLTSYATPNMDHYDAREAWISAAQETIAQHPAWPLTVASAWTAVGVDPDTRPAMPVLADFDGDAIADPALYVPGTGQWTFMLSSLGYRHVVSTLGGSAYDSYDKTPHAYDYDGDRLADPTVYKDRWTIWSLWLSGSGYSMFEGEWGGGGCSVAAGDVDGDRRGDFNYYSYDIGWWSFVLSSGNYHAYQHLYFSGSWRSTPLVADFDGDGLDDPALYDSYTGNWSILTSGGSYQNPIPVNGFGGGGDPGAAGDVDGDRFADLAVYHTQTGLWDFMLSSMSYQVLRNISL
jgi:thermolysin